MTDTKNIKWKQLSHMSFKTYYLNTEVAEINGKKTYRHTKTNRTKGGYGLGKSKVTWTETLDSPDLDLNAFTELMELAYNVKTKDI